MTQNFGILPDGTQTHLYTITGGGITATVTDFGANLVSVLLPDRKGGFVVDEGGLTSREAVYAGGDAVTGAATVISAMGAGKLAAASIDEYLSAK